MIYQDSHTTLYNKDCRSMADLPDEFVQCVVTSPPYWGLRKYSGLPDLIWGGDEKCEHRWGAKNVVIYSGEGARAASNFAGGNILEKNKITDRNISQGQFCSLCGAWKGAYGLEPTPEMYVQHTIEILREVRRVLRKDGVVFWNIGDSYMSHSVTQKWADNYGNWKGAGSVIKSGGRGSNFQASVVKKQSKLYNLKDKDLCLIPFRVAIAAQSDGWWCRSVIIWNKPNPMPESVRDRPTESHEYILMLTKSARYYWDMEAVREEQSPTTHSKGNSPRTTESFADKSDGSHKDWHEYTPDTILPAGRNLRSVWSFPTQGYPEAHFATYPEKLVEICVKAGTPEVGCCSKCGKPWVRIIDRQVNGELKDMPYYGDDLLKDGKSTQGRYHSSLGQEDKIQRETLGWQPQCKCNAEKMPSIVLDPFCGSGTSLWVSKKLNRRSVGYEFSEEYCQLTIERVRQQVLM